jgi:hypothetical protein
MGDSFLKAYVIFHLKFSVEGLENFYKSWEFKNENDGMIN